MDEAVPRGTPADWLIRARQERKTAGGDPRWAGLGASEPIGKSECILPAALGRPSRRVQPTLYLQRVTLPARKRAPAVSGTALLAREACPPTGEKAIEWRLLTHRPAATLEDAVELLGWYRCRWRVEIFFRILKAGCRVEALHLSPLERLERALVIYLLMAWRILPLVTWGRDCPDLPCEVVFDAEEWQAAWSVAKRGPPPETPPTLGAMLRLLAHFGGFLGRNGDGHPGPKALGSGLQRVRDWAIGLAVAQEVFIPTGGIVGNRMVLNLSLEPAPESVARSSYSPLSSNGIGGPPWAAPWRH